MGTLSKQGKVIWGAGLPVRSSHRDYCPCNRKTYTRTRVGNRGLDTFLVNNFRFILIYYKSAEIKSFCTSSRKSP